jgi:hypothetical protein
MTAYPDTLCPECHGGFELVSAKADRLVKRCRDCGHQWNEPREPMLFRGNYVNPAFVQGASPMPVPARLRHMLSILRMSADGFEPATVAEANECEDLVEFGLAERHETPRYSYWTAVDVDNRARR